MLSKNNVFFKQAELILRILPFIAKEKSFALKGGTAINLFVRDLPRLSVDIDLAYLPLEAREESLKNIKDSLARIAQAARGRVPGLRVCR